jgi:endonuclease/exonuclease/phosphatase family metal-dependent hydrolase
MRRTIMATGIAALSIGCGPRPLSPRDPDAGAHHFLFQSYNILDDGNGDPSTLEVIGRSNADIIAIQEMTPDWETAIEGRYAQRYPYRMFKIGGAAGMGIMSRFPVRDGGWHAGPNGWHPAWHFLVDTPGGTIDVLNVHLRNATSDNGGTVASYFATPEDHLYEIKYFTEARPEPAMPTIIAGDFNEGPDGAAVTYLEQAGYSNVLPLFHPGQPTWRYHSVGNQFTQELDHVLFDSAFVPLDAWVVNAGASDHLAVVAHLEFAPKL